MPLGEYPMTPLIVNPTTLHPIRTALKTQHPLIQKRMSPPRVSDVMVGSACDLSGPLTAARGYPMTPRHVNPDTPIEGHQAVTGAPLIPKGNRINTTFCNIRTHKHTRPRLIPIRDIRTMRAAPLTTTTEEVIPNRDMTHPRGTHQVYRQRRTPQRPIRRL